MEVNIISAVIAGVGLLAALITFFVRIEHKFGIVNQKIATLESQIEPFWKIIEDNVSKLFTPNPSEQLIKKLNKLNELGKDALKEIETELTEELKIAAISDKLNIIMALSLVQVKRSKIERG